jgi:cytochrome c-type biogenesis protein CcmH/NrfF
VNARLRPWLPIAALGVVVALALFLGRGTADTTVAARAERIANGIKCAVCQGLSVAQSKAGSARAIYDEITRQVEAGRTDADIRGYVAGRYGAELLLRPSSSGASAVVWIAPVAFGVLALGGLAVAFRKWRPAASEDALSDVDRALVARARRTLPTFGQFSPPADADRPNIATANDAVDADPDGELADLHGRTTP